MRVNENVLGEILVFLILPDLSNVHLLLEDVGSNSSLE